MAIRTDDDLINTFMPIINDIMENMTDRIEKLLVQHINTDVYGINKTSTDTPAINDYYLDGTGRPSYEFRDKAWQKRVSKTIAETCVGEIFYDGNQMTPPTANSPYLHGNYNAGVDRRNKLADLLNVSGIAGDSDFVYNKTRSPFWDNFLDELSLKIGGWLYTEFNNKGIKIPALKFFKAGM